MGKEHLTYFKVENFKRFDSLELTDIGQFNLIVGDNNVGKTSLLEAMLIDEKDGPSTMYNYHKALFLRGLDFNILRTFDSEGKIINIEYPSENYVDYIIRNRNLSLSLSFTLNEASNGVFIDHTNEIHLNSPTQFHFVFEKADEAPVLPHIKQKFKFKWLEKENYYNLFQDELNGIYLNRYLPLVLVQQKTLKDVHDDYNRFVGKSRLLRKEFIDNLQFIIPQIEEVQSLEVANSEVLGVGIKNQDYFLPISVFGEGTKRAVEIIIEIIRNKGRRLFIDEIDTGIHYSRMKNFLKTIFQVAEKNDVQLFMTTHSLECQQAFAEVFEEPEMVGHQSKVRQFTLIEQPNGQVKAIKRDWEQLEFALQTDNDTRGGRRAW